MYGIRRNFDHGRRARASGEAMMTIRLLVLRKRHGWISRESVAGVQQASWNPDYAASA